ncbi:MAG TPA: CsbD family protein [Mycobacterium sp.]|nr:CsbD family protein [Mycobacterium sp.]
MSDDHRSATEDAVRGVVEGAKGKAKEAVGNLIGRDDLVREGQAQRDKGEAQRNAGEKEAEAESARAAAAAAEKRQQSQQ